MFIIGADYHPGFQQIAFVDTETGDCGELRLEHCEGAQKFYRDLATQGKKVRVGMEASGHARWFERLLGELNIELWVGDAAVIRAKRGRKAKTDRQDARHMPMSTAVTAGAIERIFQRDLAVEPCDSDHLCYGAADVASWVDPLIPPRP